MFVCVCVCVCVCVHMRTYVLKKVMPQLGFWRINKNVKVAGGKNRCKCFSKEPKIQIIIEECSLVSSSILSAL